MTSEERENLVHQIGGVISKWVTKGPGRPPKVVVVSPDMSPAIGV